MQSGERDKYFTAYNQAQRKQGRGRKGGYHLPESQIATRAYDTIVPKLETARGEALAETANGRSYLTTYVCVTTEYSPHCAGRLQSVSGV